MLHIYWRIKEPWSLPFDFDTDSESESESGPEDEEKDEEKVRSWESMKGNASINSPTRRKNKDNKDNKSNEFILFVDFNIHEYSKLS